MSHRGYKRRDAREPDTWGKGFWRILFLPNQVAMATVKSLFTHGEGRYTTSDARTHWTSRSPRIVGAPLVSSRSGNVGSPALRVHARCQRGSPTRHGPQSEEGDADAGGDVAGAYTPLWRHTRRTWLAASLL